MPQSRERDITHGLERLGHDLRTVVDRKDDVGDARLGKSLNLVLDHGLVGELDERLGVGEGLQLALALPLLLASRGRRARRAEGEAYERPQTGSKPSDENDGWRGVVSGA